MAKIIKNIKIYTGESVLENAYLRFEKEILNIGSMDDFIAQRDDEIIETAGDFIVPGFIDVHVHGGYGIDTMDADVNKIDQMVKLMAKDGVTSIFPTTITQANENIEKALKAVAEVAKTNHLIQGIHLEGPFINSVYKGAQPEEYIQVANSKLFNQWYELSNGLIKLITYAPETIEDDSFEQTLKEKNVVASAGHTNAYCQDLKRHDVKHITHLYNAQRGLHHREAGVAGYGMLTDDCYCELIVDGYHVSKQMVNLAYKLKGAEQIELITDSMRARGLGDVISELGGQKVIVKDNQARLEDGHLAGSVLTYDNAFRNMKKFTNASISDLVKMTSTNQAKEFKLEHKGFLKEGFDADFNVFDNDLALLSTYSFGSKMK